MSRLDDNVQQAQVAALAIIWASTMHWNAWGGASRIQKIFDACDQQDVVDALTLSKKMGTPNARGLRLFVALMTAYRDGLKPPDLWMAYLEEDERIESDDEPRDGQDSADGAQRERDDDGGADRDPVDQDGQPPVASKWWDQSVLPYRYWTRRPRGPAAPRRRPPDPLFSPLGLTRVRQEIPDLPPATAQRIITHQLLASGHHFTAVFNMASGSGSYSLSYPYNHPPGRLTEGEFTFTPEVPIQRMLDTLVQNTMLQMASDLSQEHAIYQMQIKEG